MNLISNIVLVFAVIMNIVTVRSFLISQFYGRASRYILAQKNFIKLHEKYLADFNYRRNVSNLFIWTYTQAFPGLEKESK